MMYHPVFDAEEEGIGKTGTTYPPESEEFLFKEEEEEGVFVLDDGVDEELDEGKPVRRSERGRMERVSVKRKQFETQFTEEAGEKTLRSKFTTSDLMKDDEEADTEDDSFFLPSGITDIGDFDDQQFEERINKRR